MNKSKGVFGLQEPFFRPIWRRICIIVACIGWAVFEYVNGHSIWSLIFGGLGIICIWQFFIEPWDEDDES